MNKKIFLSLLLVLLVAVSMSAVAADDTAPAVDSEAGDAVTAEEPAPVEGEVIEVDGETAADIQNAIDKAKDGDTIKLKHEGVYDVEATNFELPKKVTIDGNDATIKVDGAAQGGTGATFIAQAAGTTFKDIIFINTNGHKNYGEDIKGVAIQLGIENGTVDGCMFLDFSSGIYGRGAVGAMISRCYFNGSTTHATGTGDNEAGTKAVNLMGCHHVTVTNCIFEGQMLDGISIASNSGYNTMTGNTFIDNVYAIYFGGKSTEGCIIAENNFINCGYSEDADGNILSNDFSLISTKKSASAYQIKDNYFQMDKGHVIIEAESGDTHHGYPSEIGDINMTGNTIEVAEGANPGDMVFVRIISNSGPLSPYAPINITDNTIDAGVTPVTVWLKDWDAENGVVIPATDKAATFINIEKVATADNQIIIKLEDTNGDVLGSKDITYTIAGGEEQTVTTGADGTATIGDLTDGEIVLNYAGDDKTQESSATVTFQSTATPKMASAIDASDMNTTAINPNVDGRNGAYFVVTLKDSEGTILEGKAIQIGFNGKAYDRVTDENGQAKLQINLPKVDNYTFAICFLGDDQYNASFKVCKITVNAQKGTLTVPNKSYAASAKTKSLTATFKTASGNALKGKKVTFTVNGKTYSGTTNAKGVATVNVSLSKKGTYNFTAKYAGDTTYAAISKSAKLTIK